MALCHKNPVADSNIYYLTISVGQGAAVIYLGRSGSVSLAWFQSGYPQTLQSLEVLMRVGRFTFKMTHSWLLTESLSSLSHVPLHWLFMCLLTRWPLISLRTSDPQGEKN